MSESIDRRYPIWQSQPDEVDHYSDIIRTVQVVSYGELIEVEADDDTDSRRLTPHQAWFLADVTESMAENGAVDDATAFVSALRDWAARYEDTDEAVTSHV